ncbi:MAG: restriction endonuclease [Bacteroidetes bacterium]|nr:restriction endonuclease [Bacteroidota bacterium]
MSSNNTILIRKASGESEFFDASKLKHSLRRVGADHKTSESIAFDIETSLYEGISTRKIYRMAFRMLRKHNRRNAMLYKLKQSLFELGPTGYPFEYFIGEIFKRRGFNVEVGKNVEGHCIAHEIDVIATNKTEQLLIECKYSKDQGKHISIQVSLYVRARVDDVIRKRAEMPIYSNLSFSAGVVSNTRFSYDSITYSKCNNIILLGWDYPQNNGLKEIMEQEKIFPVTALEHLTRKQKTQLMEKGIVTCDQLISNMEILTEFMIRKKKLKNLERELADILIL